MKHVVSKRSCVGMGAEGVFFLSWGKKKEKKRKRKEKPIENLVK